MSRIHPDRQQLIASELPLAGAPNPSEQSLELLDPDDYPSGPPAGRDNGWASRRTRSSSLIPNLSAVVPPSPSACARANTGRAASDPNSLQTAEPNYALESEPLVASSSSRNPPSDPRRLHSPTASVHASQEIPSEERKLEFLLRTTEQVLLKDRTIDRTWSRFDTELLQKLIAEHQTLNAGYSMRIRTMDIALNGFVIFVDCFRTNQVHPSVGAMSDILRQGVQGIILDMCEDSKTHVRKRAYRALLRMSQTDLTLVKHHVSILVQLLRNDGDGELDLVHEILAEHMSMSLSEWLQVAIEDSCFGDLRGLILDFLASAYGQRVLEGIVDHCLLEADLALHLAPVLPLSDRRQYEVITNILHLLQSIWLNGDGNRPMEEEKAARNAGAAVLWNLCLVLMGQSKTFISGTHDAPLVSVKTGVLLQGMSPQFKGSTIVGGAALFNDLVKLSLGMKVPECEEAKARATQLSKAKHFLNELELSTRYFFCFLPPVASSEEEENTVYEASAVHHFTPIQRITFFRSTANLAAKVASAAKESPAELGYPGSSTATDIAKVTTRALMVHVPVGGMTIKGSSDVRDAAAHSAACQAYSMLAAEALLLAIHLCETYLLDSTDGSSALTNDVKVRDRVKALSALAEEVDRSQDMPTEVLEAAKVVRALGSAYFKVRARTDTHVHMPEWLMSPPPFPAWETPKPETQREPTGSGRRNSRGQKRSSEVSPSQERCVRGRGAVRANDDFTADSWHAKVDTEPSPLPRPDTGITICGASRADTSISKWDTDASWTEPSLFARLDRRENEPRYGGVDTHASREYADHYVSASYRSHNHDYTPRAHHRHHGYASTQLHYDGPQYNDHGRRGAPSWDHSRR